MLLNIETSFVSLMSDCIVNWDISHYLLNFLFIADIVSLMKVTRVLYQLIVNTRLFEQLQILKCYPGHTLTGCVQNNLLLLLEKLGKTKKIIWPPALDNLLEIAAQYNHLTVLDWLFLHQYPADDDTYNEAIITAASLGHVSVIEWFRCHHRLINASNDRNEGFNQPPMDWLTTNQLMLDIIESAAMFNRWVVLDWLQSEGYKVHEYVVFETAINLAVRNGHLETLDWFRSHQCVFTKIKDQMEIAVAARQLEVLDWYVIHFNGLQWMDDCAQTAVRNGVIPVLQWLKVRNYLFDPINAFIRLAVSNNQMAVLYWFHIFYQWKVQSIITLIACFNNNLTLLRWFVNNGYVIHMDVGCANYAAKFNNITILELLRLHSYRFCYNTTTFQSAAENGHVDVFRWFKLNAYPITYTPNTVNAAAGNGHLVILDWLVNHQYPLKYTCKAINKACFNGHLEILRWWVRHNYPLKYSCEAMDWASQNGHLTILQWWLDSGYPLKYSNAALAGAATNKHLAVLDWWLNSGCLLKYDRYFFTDLQNASPAVSEWALANSDRFR